MRNVGALTPRQKLGINVWVDFLVPDGTADLLHRLSPDGDEQDHQLGTRCVIRSETQRLKQQSVHKSHIQTNFIFESAFSITLVQSRWKTFIQNYDYDVMGIMNIIDIMNIFNIRIDAGLRTRGTQ